MAYTNFPGCQAIDMQGVPMCDRLATLGAPPGDDDPYVYCDEHRESYRGRYRHVELEWAVYAREAACGECKAECDLGATEVYNPMRQQAVTMQRREWRKALSAERCDDGTTVCEARKP